MEEVVKVDVAEVKNFLRQLSLQVSDLVQGLERHIFIGNIISNIARRVSVLRLRRFSKWFSSEDV